MKWKYYFHFIIYYSISWIFYILLRSEFFLNVTKHKELDLNKDYYETWMTILKLKAEWSKLKTERWKLKAEGWRLKVKGEMTKGKEWKVKDESSNVNGIE